VINLAWSLCNLSCFQQLPNQGQLKSHSGRSEQKRFPAGCIGRPSAPALCNSRLHGGSGTALTFLINFLLADHLHTQAHLFCISCLILATGYHMPQARDLHVELEAVIIPCKFGHISQNWILAVSRGKQQDKTPSSTTHRHIDESRSRLTLL